MTGYDERRAYADAQYEERDRIHALMAELEPVRRAVRDRVPLTLTCARGHRLFTAELVDDGDPWRPSYRVRPAGDPRGRSSRVTEPGSIIQVGGTVCAASGCPQRTPSGQEFCADHAAGRESIVIDNLKTRFVCPLTSCGWSDSVTTNRLLKAVSASLVAGNPDAIPVAGHAAARRSRRA